MNYLLSPKTVLDVWHVFLIGGIVLNKVYSGLNKINKLTYTSAKMCLGTTSQTTACFGGTPHTTICLTAYMVTFELRPAASNNMNPIGST